MADGRIFILAGIAVLLRILYTRHKHATRTLNLPPGPPPLPLVGNLFDIPTTQLGSRLRSLSDKYGDIVHLSALGRHTILLGSYEAARALLDDRSATTADRQGSVMADLVGFADWEFTFFGHTPAWRRHRRQFHQMFHRGAVVDYQPVQRQHAAGLVRRMVRDPARLVAHIRQYFGGSIMQVVYGIKVAEKDDRYIAIAEEAVGAFIDITVPGRYLVEALPFLRHVPSWVPGAGFKRDAAERKKSVDALRSVPYLAAKHDIQSGTASPSVVMRMLERDDGSDSAAVEELCQNVSAIAYLTGADTTFSSAQAFVLAMVQNAPIQRKAQAELDAVVGPRRLPSFADRAHLPYLNALVKECFRWLVVTPIGFPHRAAQDEHLGGYLIPEGASLIPNVWAMSRDPAMYPDPEAFRPERFLDPRVRDPTKFTFGFGRRICPGRHFADQALFIIAAVVLHTVTLAPPLDGAGHPVEVAAGYTTDMVTSYPEPFECRITPRPGRGELLSAVEDEDEGEGEGEHGV